MARPLIDRIIQPKWTMVVQDATSSCRAVSSLAPLAQLARGRVMAPIDLGPGILAATGHSVFAAPCHRNNDGNRAMLDLMMAAPAAARQMLSDRRVDYVVICAGSLEQTDFVRLAPQGLAARLGRGATPDFLQPGSVASGQPACCLARPFALISLSVMRSGQSVAATAARAPSPFHHPSSPAKAGDPVIRGVRDQTETPRRTGFPRSRE